MSLVVMTTFASVRSLERREKHIDTTKESSHPSNWINSLRHRASLSKEDNKVTTEVRKKNSQTLIGDYIKLDSKRDKDDTLWDDGIIISSAGNGKERKSNGNDEDEKKTLSQQVKEGKYGLIQNELYPEEPKRPGIISYFSNSEVPKDNLKNLGGLDEDEIWLAENHVLVLRGGNFPEHEAKSYDLETQKWPPIDDYEAPKRPVKIPTKPKVPPPFPIQLSEGGPIEIIGRNRTKTGENATIDFEDTNGSKGYLPGEGPFFSFPPSDALATPDLVKSINNSRRNDSQKKYKSDSTAGITGSVFPALPPDAVFVLPPVNMSDYDEDDQSIYYPSPYSFLYSHDNTTVIPPGPLVPGIILPPPPDFFSSTDDKKPTTKAKTKQLITTPIPKSRQTYLPPRKTDMKLYKTTTLSTIKVGILPTTNKSFVKTKSKNVTQYNPFYVEVTTPTPIKSTTQIPVNFVNRSAIENSIETSTQTNPWESVVSSKNVPLSANYANSVSSSVDHPAEETPSSIKIILKTKHAGRVPSQASYYFYEEKSEDPTTVSPSLYYHTTIAPFFKVQTLPLDQEKKKYYSLKMLPSRQTSKDINVKLIDSIVKDPQVFHYTETRVSTPVKYERGNQRENISLKDNIPQKERSRILSDSTSIYYDNISGRSLISLNPYYATPKIQNYYNEETTEKSNGKLERKPKPIYQYSFEAARYSKRGRQKQKEQDLATYNEYQGIQTVDDQYNYERIKAVREQQIQTEKISSESLSSDRIPLESISSEIIPSEKIPYKTQSFYSTTASPFTDTTIDPHQAYFTNQDEQLLDDVTKEYFTVFGKKLTSKLQSTTPLYEKSSKVTENLKHRTYVSNNYHATQYKTSKVKVHYGDQTQGSFSLKEDTLVNYKHPLSTINPDSEIITIGGSQAISQEYQVQGTIPVENQGRDYRPYSLKAHSNYTPVRNYVSQRTQLTRDPNEIVHIPDPRSGLYPTRPVSLTDDIAVNYRIPHPPINPDAEFISPIQNSKTDQANSYFSYRLPGDGGHFYFLTPQAIVQKQGEGGYLYTKTRSPRLIRDRRDPASNI